MPEVKPVDTAGIRSLAKRLSSNLGYGFIKEFLDYDVPTIADELDTLRARVKELEEENEDLRYKLRSWRGY